MKTQLDLFIKSQQKRLDEYVKKTQKELKEACQLYRQTSNQNDTNRAFGKKLINTNMIYANVVRTTDNYVKALHKQRGI